MPKQDKVQEDDFWGGKSEPEDETDDDTGEDTDATAATESGEEEKVPAPDLITAPGKNAKRPFEKRGTLMAVKDVKEEAARTLGKKPRDLMAHLDNPKLKEILAPDAIVRLRSELEKAAKANEARRKRKAEAVKPDVDIQTPKAPEFSLDDLPDLPSQPKQPKTQTVVDSSPIKKDEPEPESKRKRAFEAVDTAMARLDEAKIKYSFQFNGSA